MVAQQPAVLPQVTVVEPKLQPKPAAMIFALVLTILCACHLFIPAFACLIPGLVFGIVVCLCVPVPSQHHVSFNACLCAHIRQVQTSHASCRVLLGDIDDNGEFSFTYHNLLRTT